MEPFKAFKRKTLIVDQLTAGGDLLFIQKIILNYANKGFRLVVPIMEDLAWLRDQLVRHEFVEYPLMSENDGVLSGYFKFADAFVDLRKRARDTKNPESVLFKTPILYNGGDEERGFIFLALDTSHLWLNDPSMEAKYRFVELDPSDWPDHVHLVRRPDAERELYYKILGLTDSSVFSFINDRMDSGHIVETETKGTFVRARPIEGFSPIDWAFVMERAERIVTVDSTFTYLAEALGLQKPLVRLPYRAPTTFSAIEDILTLDWDKAEPLKKAS